MLIVRDQGGTRKNKRRPIIINKTITDIISVNSVFLSRYACNYDLYPSVRS